MKVVLLHAFPLDERMWEPQLEPLREYDVVAPRLYGRGTTIDEYGASILAEQRSSQSASEGPSSRPKRSSPRRIHGR